MHYSAPLSVSVRTLVVLLRPIVQPEAPWWSWGSRWAPQSVPPSWCAQLRGEKQSSFILARPLSPQATSTRLWGHAARVTAPRCAPRGCCGKRVHTALVWRRFCRPCRQKIVHNVGVCCDEVCTAWRCAVNRAPSFLRAVAVPSPMSTTRSWHLSFFLHHLAGTALGFPSLCPVGPGAVRSGAVDGGG